MTILQIDWNPSPEIFKIGSELIKISLNAKNIEAVNNFQNIFSKLLNIYLQREPGLFD